MSVSTTKNRTVALGDGTNKTFSFPYYFFNTTDLAVYKYDILLGGVTNTVLGTDFTVSGTVNSQGFYPSGANVVMTTAPLTTDIIIVVRNGPEIQNYALLNGGIISSTALVQQLDYLTLLAQRLEDQVSRCLQIPDGLGVALSTVLPSTAALSPNYYLKINSGGNGVTLSLT